MPKRRGCLQILVLIRVQRPRHETISSKGQDTKCSPYRSPPNNWYWNSRFDLLSQERCIHHEDTSTHVLGAGQRVGSESLETWPLQNIAIANIVVCMAYKGGVGGASYIAQKSCSSIAIV